MSTDDVDTTTANDIGGANDMLSPMEGTDSDDVLNDDGDDVVDPPDGWVGADKYGMSAEEQAEGETLDQRLAEEVPDVTAADIDDADSDDAVVEDVAYAGSDLAPPDPGVHRADIDGVPEDGDSFFPVVE